jgi:predicted ATPase/class 3 adenylate cyclase/Tfp pilus assembly protein PilF
MRRDLPSGTVTFLFTDVEGSTRLLHELGPEGYAARLAEHRRVVREACTARGGVEVDTQGDAFFLAFPQARAALEAARAITEELASGPITLRIGLHTGTPLLTEEGYVGEDVHFGARVAASAHGGQVLLSRATQALLDERYELVELGEHRLKDIPEPVVIFQLGDRQFPPLKTISNTNLPRPANSFIGREKELQEVLATIERGARLLTLTGPGGSGKTRLALEAAATLVPEYSAGVFWVALAALRDPALVPEQISQTLGAKDGLREHIGEREILLLLDNLEQVIDGAAELSNLVSACPNLTLLVTSRELLRVGGEVEYRVPPLVEAEAVSLFIERAQVEPSDAVAELCQRLDNLPLAVELAAARARALSPAQIVERLARRLDLLKGGRDADPRQQTLRATIEWSYDLLSEDEQSLFGRLSVFSGGCTLEAAEHVCDADLDALQSLVEKSLLRFSSERYWMLETIREYAAEQLANTNEADNRRARHAAYFLRLAEEAEPELRGGPAQVAWLDRLEQERDNLRASLAWAQDADVELGLCLGAALVPFWHVRGPIGEARAWLTTLLERAGAESLELQAKVLPWAGDCALLQGDYEEAERIGKASLRVATQLDDPMAIGQALHDLGEVAFARGHHERARELYEQAISTASEVGYRAPGSVANLGVLALVEHDYERASELFCRALALFREQSKPAGTAMVLASLATVARRRGRYSEALKLLEDSLELGRELAYEGVILCCLVEFAALLALHDDAEEAARLLGASEKMLQKLAVVLSIPDEKTRAETLAAVQARLGEGAYAEALASGRLMDVDEAIGRGLRVVREAVAQTGSIDVAPGGPS